MKETFQPALTKTIWAAWHGALAGILILAHPPTAHCQPEWLTSALQASPSVHKDASSLTLFDDVAITFEDDGTATTRLRLAYRILRPAGEGLRTITIPTSPTHVLQHLQGWHIAKGKETETLDEGDAVVMNPAATAGYYTDARQTVASFADVQPGDVVAFEYEVEETGPTARYQSNSFQIRQPVVRSTFSITIPPGWSLRTAGRKLEPVRETTTGNTTVWAASDLPYEVDEPLTPLSHLPGRRLRVVAIGGAPHSIADWKGVASWTQSRTEGPVAPDGSVSALCSTLGKAALPWQTFSAAAKFVQKDIRYVALELGEGGWTPRPAGETLRNRFGDCKDKTTLLRSILRNAGIPSSSVLASTVSGVSPDLPTPFQFNHAIIAIPDSALGTGHTYASAITDGWLFFDPTDPDVPPGKIPPILEGNRVLIVSEGKLAKLPETGASDNLVSVDAEGTLAADGLVSTSLRMVFRGERAYSLRELHRSTDDLTQLWLSYVKDAIPDAAVSNVSIADSTDSLAVTCSLTGRGLLSSAGVEGLFRVNFLEIGTPERLTARTRTNPLWLGPPSSERIHVRWNYAGYLVGPDTVFQHSQTCHGNSFTTIVRSAGKGSEFTHTITRSDDSIPASEYGSVRAYLSALQNALGSSIQLRKTLR